MKRIVVLLSFIIYGTFVYAQLVLQNPLFTNNSRESIYFIDVNTGYTVGEHGTILKTTDGGDTWKLMAGGTTSSLYSVFFVNSNVGYAGGVGPAYSEIYKTTDGGSTWTNLKIYTISGTIRSIFFVNENIGFVAANSLYKTTDGGLTWTGVGAGGSRIYFGDVNKGYAYGGSYVYKTINGGTSWNSVYSNISYSVLDGCFPDVNTGYILLSNKTIDKTINGGMSWTTINLPAIGQYVYFLDPNVGYVLTENSVLKTIDGGSTWTTFPLPTPTEKEAYRRSFYFSDVNHGYFVCYNGEVYKTNDGGSSWTTTPNRIINDLYSVSSPSASVAYAVGSLGTILKTTNGGETWNKTPIQSKSDFFAVYFTYPNTGFVAGSTDTLFKTLDGGLSWIPIKLPNSLGIKSIFFPTAEIGFAVGNQQRVFKTTDGGNTWLNLSFPGTGINFDFTSVLFTSASKGFITATNVLKEGRILITTDGGVTWDFVLSTGQNITISPVSFPDENTGFTIVDDKNYGGYGARPYKTTDGGYTWQSMNFQHLIEIPDGKVFFITPLIGYDFGNNGYGQRTIDGINWTLLPNVTGKNYNSICFNSANEGYIVGAYGTIAKIKDGVPTRVYEINNEKSIFSLYPNPANDKVKIFTGSQLNNKILITIFTPAGQNILHFKYENQNSIELDVSMLKSGWYLLTIESSLGVESKKLIIE
jgi:photosystem II stability/assembly factor-like uncharacterized protein